MNRGPAPMTGSKMGFKKAKFIVFSYFYCIVCLF
jgi:hypothetical protein